MASRLIEHLEPGVQPFVPRIITTCKDAGVDLLVYCTLRGFREQAILYRNGRTRAQIRQKQDQLLNRGFGLLADIIDVVGPQMGNRILTNAGPGESWHQYGMAIDAVPLIHGKAQWIDPDTDTLDEWKVYHQSAGRYGFHTLSWEKPHVQMMHPSRHPLSAYTNAAILYTISKVSEMEDEGLL